MLNKINLKMEPEEKKHVIFFDLDHTLYDYHASHAAGLQKAFRTCWSKFFPTDSFEDFKQHYKKARKWVKKYHYDSATAHSRALYFQKAIEGKTKELDIKLISDLITCYWKGTLDSMEPYEGVKEALNKLKALNYRLGIITNMEASIQYKKIVKLGLKTEFDNIITSEEAGHEKPHPLIYSHALNVFNIDPKFTWMIGDNFEHDVSAADWIGMNAIWFNPNNNKKPPNANEVDFFEVNSFSELVSLIQNQQGKAPLEGYIKFEAIFNKKEEPIFTSKELKPLDAVRQQAYNVGFIGYYGPEHPETPDVGYGNVSQRYTRDGQFIVTGTKTGQVKELKPKHYVLVTDYQINKNLVVAKGVIRPSSESMTHAAIYEVAPEVNYVLHIHNIDLWKYAAQHQNTDEFLYTPETATYGTPEMAQSIQEIYKKHGKQSFYRPIAMLGHKEGLITWGNDGKKLVNVFKQEINNKI